MAEIKCGIIKDLLPLYAEELTSEESNDLIKQHISECESCQKQYEEIKNDFSAKSDYNSKKETATINYLKKSNQNRRRWIAFGAVSAVALCLCLIAAQLLFAPKPVSTEQIAIENIDVANGNVHIDGQFFDSASKVSSLKFSESDGTVFIEMKSSLIKPFAKSGFSADYKTSDKIDRIVLNDNVIWENGIAIPQNVSAVYAAKHEYIGDAYKNSLSVLALEMTQDLGMYKNELQTTVEPYLWTIKLEDDMSSFNRNKLKSKMEYYSAMLIATIDNLGSVRFVYNADNANNEFVFTEADADSHYGGSVKEAAKTASGLYDLMKNW